MFYDIDNRHHVAIKRIPDIGIIPDGDPGIDFVIDLDSEGKGLPDGMTVKRIIVFHGDVGDNPVETISELNIYSKSTRLPKELVYQDTWKSGTSATVYRFNEVEWMYFNLDRENRIIGSVRIKSKKPDAAIIITVFFE